MKILLTGAAGFIGSCYLGKLNALGIDDVLIADAHGPEGHPNLARKKFKDFVTREQLFDRIDGKLFADIDLIVHLGACADTTERDRAFLQRNNFEYSRRLAEWALARGKQFHYASSASVYGSGEHGYDDAPANLKNCKPLNLYAESKSNFDGWIIDNRLTGRVVGFRYFNVFGPNEYHKGEMRSMVSKAYDQIASTGRVNLFATTRPGRADGSEERDFIYVKDANEVMAFFVEHPDRRGIFNVGTGRARSFKDLALAVFVAMGREPRIDFIPMPEALRGQYQYFTQADLANLRKAGFARPFSTLEVSVEDYVKNYLAGPNKYF